MEELDALRKASSPKRMSYPVPRAVEEEGPCQSPCLASQLVEGASDWGLSRLFPEGKPLSDYLGLFARRGLLVSCSHRLPDPE